MRKTVAILFATALLVSVGAAPASAGGLLPTDPGTGPGGSHQTGDGGFCWC